MTGGADREAREAGEGRTSQENVRKKTRKKWPGPSEEAFLETTGGKDDRRISLDKDTRVLGK